MNERKVIQTGKAPKAIGPYSQALLAGNMLYISGQLGIDPATGKLVEGGTAEQARQALKNVMAILMEANGNLHDVVQVQVFLTDIADFAAVNEVYKSFFSEPYPARAAVQAAALPAGAKVEILAVAVL
ncbi:MAG: Rid family detoxifying hydrolase [Planctomycetaceae bacterium]|nr:Rid family detoxifying hydrolase [Planctomycetaceae bacterium]